MTNSRHTTLGAAMFLLLWACSEEPTTPPTVATGGQQLSKLVSLRVAGFVEAAGIT